MIEETGTTHLKAYSVKQLAEVYEVSPKVLRTWISEIEKEVGLKNGHFYNHRQIKIIFDEFGIPPGLKEKPIIKTEPPKPQ
jgi:transposase